MKILKYYDDVFQANVDRELLANEGIPSEVLNEHMASMLHHSMSSLRPYLVVPDSFYEDAVRKIGLEEIRETICLECGSKDISYSLPKKHRRLNRLMIGLLALLGGPFGNIRRVNHCNCCGNEFRP